MVAPDARGALRHEALALMTRLAQARPYAVHMPMVAAAALPASAQGRIDAHMGTVLGSVRQLIRRYVAWLDGPEGAAASPASAYRRLTLLRLRFQGALTQFDLFSDVLTQRSEHVFGVWLAGLDILAKDALHLEGRFYEAPPAVTYLDRGIGAAIRRARTRLPGGRSNPVAIIRVPRERMVGAGIASSLVHEVGHQGAALLDLVDSLRPALRALQAKAGPERPAWLLWERWISEIVADFWSVGQIGVGSTYGLLSVVSLPRFFVFRLGTDGPHPAPWIRVILSAAIGNALYPDPQWARLQRLWQTFYPPANLDPGRARTFQLLLGTMPALVGLLVDHRPARLRGASLREAFPVDQRQPTRLRALYARSAGSSDRLSTMRPSLAFAVLGQARADGRLRPDAEALLIDRLLTLWATRRAHQSTGCACDACTAAQALAV